MVSPRTIAHELGHSLGLQHLEVPGNLMTSTGGSAAGTALTSSQCTDARANAASPDKQGEWP